MISYNGLVVSKTPDVKYNLCHVFPEGILALAIFNRLRRHCTLRNTIYSLFDGWRQRQSTTQDKRTTKYWILSASHIHELKRSKVATMPPILSEEESALDPYVVLGIGAGATTKEAERAFRKKSLKYHPDKVRFRPFMIHNCHVLMNLLYRILTLELVCHLCIN